MVRATLERGELRAVQTPQAFRATHCARLINRASEPLTTLRWSKPRGKVVVVLGDHQNIKITHEADLAYAAQLLSDSGVRRHGGWMARVSTCAFSDDSDRVLVLGGVEFEGAQPEGS